jgi:transposase
MPHIKGIAREQAALMPQRVEDYVEGTSVVRFIDEFVRTLPMEALGFERVRPAGTGRPGYDPRMMLSLWIYGYVNGLTSSRKLEREAGRNVEVMWLMEMLRPDFKTICDFRKDHKSALTGVFRSFTELCRTEGLVRGELVAIDGSKFRAVNSSDCNYSKDKLTRLQEQIDRKIEQYLEQAEVNDAAEAEQEQVTITDEQMREKLARLRERKGMYEALVKELHESGAKQISTTDPESRSMKMRSGINVCYNAQTAVDAQNKLIVVAQVTNEVTDQNQLGTVAREAKAVLGVEQLVVVADKGYSNSVELEQCDEAGITTYVPQPQWRRNDNAGRFSKEDFRYEGDTDTYTCPADSTLTFRYESKQTRRTVRYYMSEDCATCALRDACLGPRSKRRRLARRADEQAITNAARRAAERPDLTAVRKTLVEHPFGTIKRWINGGYFLLKGLDGVRAEFSLAALAYNIKRVWRLKNLAPQVQTC